jgi:hypothetical protein
MGSVPSPTAPTDPDDLDSFIDPWGRRMFGPTRLSRLDLRYFLTDTMAGAPERTWTPTELAAVVERAGFSLSGRGSKVVSDHLRAEVNRGRVVRVGRGRYRVGEIPGSTRRRIRYAVGHRQRALADHHRRTAARGIGGPGR